MTVKNNPVLSVDFMYSYDTYSDAVVNTGRACINLAALQNGLIKEVGSNRIGLLLAIVSFMDNEGKAFPSQRKLAELTGQSINTVNKLINELLEIEVDGQRLLRRELVGKGIRKRSLYYITDGLVTASEEETEKEVEKKPYNSKDFAEHFSEVYENEFGQGYTINYGRDLSMIKNKLLPNYDEETLLKIIEVAVKQYKTKWANPKYPLPTIPMLATWLANNAFAELQKAQHEAAKQERRAEVAVAQDDSDKFLDMFGEE